MYKKDDYRLTRIPLSSSEKDNPSLASFKFLTRLKFCVAIVLTLVVLLFFIGYLLIAAVIFIGSIFIFSLCQRLGKVKVKRPFF